MSSVPVVSYLTGPNAFNPSLTPRHGSTINMMLMAATASIVTLLFLFLVGITFYLVRRRLLRKREEEKARDAQSRMNYFNPSSTILGSERDVESWRNTRTTCDSCSTRLHFCRSAIVPHLPDQSQSQSIRSRSSLIEILTPQNEEEGKTIPLNEPHRFTVQLDQLDSPMTDNTATDSTFDFKKSVGKTDFDWDRCAFELKEEEAMWLPARPMSLSSGQPLAKSQVVLHNRALSESAFLQFPPRSHQHSIRKTNKTIAWSDLPLFNESQRSPVIDYFGDHRLGQPPNLSHSPIQSPGLLSAVVSSDHSLSLSLPVSPFLVHTPQRHSFCVQAEIQTWEAQSEASLRPFLDSRRRTHTGSATSLALEETSFSDPFAEARGGLQGQHPSNLAPNSIHFPRCLSPLPSILKQDSNSSKTFFQDVRKVPRSLRSVTLPLSSSPGPHPAEIEVNQSYLPVETPLQTHRFSRRGAVVQANWPASPTAQGYTSPAFSERTVGD